MWGVGVGVVGEDRNVRGPDSREAFINDEQKRVIWLQNIQMYILTSFYRTSFAIYSPFSKFLHSFAPHTFERGWVVAIGPTPPYSYASDVSKSETV